MDRNLRETMNEIEAIYDRLVWHAYRIVKKIDIAEDVVQEVTLKIIQLNPAFADSIHRKRYLYRAIRNQSLTFLEDSKKSVMFSEEWMQAVHQCADEVYFSKSTLNWLIASLKEQPPEVADAFIRHALYKERINDIAKELNMKPETLRQQIHRLRLKLKKTYLLFMEMISLIRLIFLVT